LATLPISYYIDWTGLENFDYDFDDAGLPRYDYGGDIGLKYNAITIAQWGLFNLQEWESQKSESYKEQALRCADWLVANAKPWKQGMLAWIYDYGFDLYGPYPPWISGMAQGEAVSLLLRCNQIEPREEFLNVARGAIKAFDFLFEEGGVAATLKDGSIFFQEYPTSPAVHVLNGGIFALLGVHDYATYFENDHYRAVTQQTVETLKHHWRDWDSGVWTLYDLYPLQRYASHMYHELHIRQFRALALLFKMDEFDIVADRWQRRQKGILNRVFWAAHKVYEKISMRWTKK
jgi:heparosan-N-sulfate-glucuronate 5-epimerase